MGQHNCHPQPGDLIAISRKGYQHWALYVGDGYVIHVTSVDSRCILGSSSSTSTTRAKVKKELLKDVAGKNKWRVNNKYDRFWTPLPVKEIIHHAEQWIDTEVPYDLLGSNCEHFVTLLRYGVSVSGQVRKALVGIIGTLNAALFGVVAVAPPAAVGSCLAAAVAVTSTVAVRSFLAMRVSR